MRASRWVIWLAAMLVVAVFALTACSSNAGEEPSAEGASQVDVESAASAQEGAASAATAVADRETAQEDTPVAAESASAAEAEAAEPEAVEEPAADVRAYVLNKNSRKFHFPSCSSVGDIKDSNRWDVEMTRDEVVSMGYEPCKRCNP